MENKELESLLEKLHAELENMESVDEKDMQLLRGIEKDINELLQQTDRTPIAGRLQEAIQQFEAFRPHTHHYAF